MGIDLKWKPAVPMNVWLAKRHGAEKTIVFKESKIKVILYEGNYYLPEEKLTAPAPPLDCFSRP